MACMEAHSTTPFLRDLLKPNESRLLSDLFRSAPFLTHVNAFYLFGMIDRPLLKLGAQTGEKSIANSSTEHSVGA